MNLKLFIARRYLFAKKSHNVINVVSLISAASIAVGTAALIIILSVFNGFNALVEDSLSTIEPDFLVKPSKGKFFSANDSIWTGVVKMEQIRTMSCILEDNVFLLYDGRRAAARARGVDSVYEKENFIASSVVDGQFALRSGETQMAAIGEGLAASMDINPRFVPMLELYYPRTDAALSLANPLGSVECVRVRPSCIFRINADNDADLLILSREAMLSLTGRAEDEVSAIEIRTDPNIGKNGMKRLQRELVATLGPDFKVLDRKQQNPALYKMFRYEKAAVLCIMFLIVMVLCLGVFGSLRMLIIEKEADIFIYGAIGAGKQFIRQVFTFEGWLVILSGGCVGLCLGIAVCLLQQHLGIIKMPGNYLIEYYPVILNTADILLAAAGVALLGWVTAKAASRRI